MPPATLLAVLWFTAIEKPSAGREQAPEMPAVPYAELADHVPFDAIEQRLLDPRRWPEGFDRAAAEQIADLLWEDFGDPELNYWNQLLTLIAVQAAAPRFDRAAREVLQRKLLDYWERGGFQIAADPMTGLLYPAALSAVAQNADEHTQRVLLDATEMLAAAALRPPVQPAESDGGTDWEAVALLYAAAGMAEQTARRVCELLGLERDSADCRLLQDLYTQPITDEADRYIEQALERGLLGTRESPQDQADPGGSSAVASAPGAAAELRAELRKLQRERGDAARVRRVAALARRHAGRRDPGALRLVLRVYQRLAAGRETARAVVVAIERELIGLLPEVVSSPRLVLVWAQAARALPPRAGRELAAALARRTDAVQGALAQRTLRRLRAELERALGRTRP